MPGKGKFSLEEDFHGGPVFARNRSPREDNGSIYIPRILSKRYLICLAKGSFPGKRVFLGGGLYLRENGARKAFWASVLNKFEFLTMHHLKKNRDRRITVVYILPLSSHGER